MIEYIKGEITELTPTMAVVEAYGVGYAVNISLNTFTELQGNKDAKLYIHEVLTTGGRDDSYTLYGFFSKKERELYRLLITVSGVGANTARMILSSASPQEICGAVANGDEKLLKSIKGIGLKTAQRIIIDLKDKILQSDFNITISANSTQTVDTGNSVVKQEAVGALTMLGFPPAIASKAVTQIIKENGDIPVEQVVKLSLKIIK